MTDPDLLAHHDRKCSGVSHSKQRSIRPWWDGPDASLLWRAELLRYADDRHLSALTSEDLLPLLAYGDMGVRTAAVRDRSHQTEGLLMDDRTYLTLLGALDACRSEAEITELMDRHRLAWGDDPLWDDLNEAAAQKRVRLREGPPMSREEALAAAREALEHDPVDPDLLQTLRTIIPQEEALQIWMISNSGWLSGRRPLEVWRSDRAVVIGAARCWAEPIRF